jgi:hypothetical protein
MSNPPIFTSQQPDQTFHFDQNIPFSIPPLTTTDGLTYQPLEFYYDAQQLNPFNNTDTTDNTFQLTTVSSY